jgi:hypothetical protein
MLAADRQFREAGQIARSIKESGPTPLLHEIVGPPVPDLGWARPWHRPGPSLLLVQLPELVHPVRGLAGARDQDAYLDG